MGEENKHLGVHPKRRVRTRNVPTPREKIKKVFKLDPKNAKSKIKDIIKTSTEIRPDIHISHFIVKLKYPKVWSIEANNIFERMGVECSMVIDERSAIVKSTRENLIKWFYKPERRWPKYVTENIAEVQPWGIRNKISESFFKEIEESKEKVSKVSISIFPGLKDDEYTFILDEIRGGIGNKITDEVMESDLGIISISADLDNNSILNIAEKNYVYKIEKTPKIEISEFEKKNSIHLSNLKNKTNQIICQ